ncbi:hypothetical protein J3F83DRAFT_740836 [Trichoderma novae-zelandiae]
MIASRGTNLSLTCSFGPCFEKAGFVWSSGCQCRQPSYRRSAFFTPSFSLTGRLGGLPWRRMRTLIQLVLTGCLFYGVVHATRLACVMKICSDLAASRPQSRASMQTPSSCPAVYEQGCRACACFPLRQDRPLFSIGVQMTRTTIRLGTNCCVLTGRKRAHLCTSTLSELRNGLRLGVRVFLQQSTPDRRIHRNVLELLPVLLQQ